MIIKIFIIINAILGIVTFKPTNIINNINYEYKSDLLVDEFLSTYYKYNNKKINLKGIWSEDGFIYSMDKLDKVQGMSDKLPYYKRYVKDGSVVLVSGKISNKIIIIDSVKYIATVKEPIWEDSTMFYTSTKLNKKTNYEITATVLDSEKNKFIIAESNLILYANNELKDEKFYDGESVQLLTKNTEYDDDNNIKCDIVKCKHFMDESLFTEI